ncbi:MAG: flagellar hook-associated protein FlgK [Acidobacteriota bacterium]|nr:flagellar hook-associated protein FlgK [Acidobacteriota bacterium]
MSSLFATLGTSAQSLSVYERALETVQNNVSNASTPGYATQTVDFSALSFDPQSGLAGGVSAGTSSSRDQYADESVRRQLSNLGTAQQSSASLGAIESSFDVTGQQGIPAALSRFFNSFSALSVAPNSPGARSSAIVAAQAVVSSFRQTASDLAGASSSAEKGIQSQIGQINALARQIQSYNVQRAQSGHADFGLDANQAAALEKLSSLAGISVTTAPDGSASVLLNGQIPLVLGSQSFALQAGFEVAGPPAPANPGGIPGIRISDVNGRDVTSHLTQGSLSGLLQFRNTTLAGLRGSYTQQGSLNSLAAAFANRVNTLLQSGTVTDAAGATRGVALFTYDSANPTRTAESLSLTGIDGSQLATAQPGPPPISNGIALSLTNLAQGLSAADQVNGLTYTGYFAQVAAGIGQGLSDAKAAADFHGQASTQAQALRARLSGVSLDAEAVRLIEYQKAYNATAKLISVLDQITQSTLDIVK